MKYQLLLKDILRYTERAQLIKEQQDLMKAVEIMLVVPKAADDMMNVGRLNGFPGKLTAQGKLIKQGILLFADLTPVIAGLDANQAAELMSSFQQSIGGGGGGGAATANSTADAQCDNQATATLLTTNMIGSSQMSDSTRILLNQLLANHSHQLKLRERQTFLFEQTIIFSEVARRSDHRRSEHHHHHHSSSGSNHLAASGAASFAESTSASSGRRNKLQMSGVFSASAQSSSATNSNVHPTFPHSHNHLTNAVELCCSINDCQQPQTQSPCDRLMSIEALNEPEMALATCRHHHHPYYGPTATSGGGGGQYFAAPSYEYKNHLSINKVALIDKHYGPQLDLAELDKLLRAQLDVDLESRRFMLKSRDPSQENVIYLLQTGCAHDRDDWVCSIKSMLECQLDFLRALQSPIAYQRGLTKEG